MNSWGTGSRVGSLGSFSEDDLREAYLQGDRDRDREQGGESAVKGTAVQRLLGGSVNSRD